MPAIPAVTFRIVTAVGLAFCFPTTAARAAEPTLRVATFYADVTPPLGDGACVGFMPQVLSIEHPLQLRGIVLRADERTFVLAGIDFCGVCNSSDVEIRDALAAAARTTRARVALQSLHQHTAPALDAEAMRLLHGDASAELRRHLDYTDDIGRRGARAVTAALSHLQPVSRIVGTRATVERVAANRRVPQPDGTIAVRSSLTQDLDVRNAPEGLVDPWLRTVTFFGDAQPVAQLHYYATHPQSYYGDARISWDTVGMARGRLEEETGIFQVYFTGCGGNVALGKYNDGTPRAREDIAERLLDAMRRSAAAATGAGTGDSSGARVDAVVVAESLSPQSIAWDAAPIHFTVREDGGFAPERLRRQLQPDQPFSTRLTAACFSAFAQRLRDGYVAQATRLRLGEFDIIHLPGEPFVEFQLYAQGQADTGAFTCVAGYGESGVWYYGPDSIYSDRGGYEQTWSVTGPCQASVETALRSLVARP